jgi:hypothetical protein
MQISFSLVHARKHCRLRWAFILEKLFSGL